MKLLVYNYKDYDKEIHRVESVDHILKTKKTKTLEQLQQLMGEFNSNPKATTTASIIDLPDDARPVIEFLLGGKDSQLSRYKPGDYVWIMEQNKPVCKRIEVVRYFQGRNGDFSENYHLKDDYDHVKQANEVFPDKESLMVKLFEL